MVEEVCLTIPQHLWDEMRRHVDHHFPEEACGLVGGQDWVSGTVIPVTNELHSTTAYRMAPEEQMNALLRLEDANLDLLAIFHSHPSGPAYPSITDIEKFAYPGTLTLIWSCQSGAWLLRGFHILGEDVYPVLLNIEPET
jgi:proteasome lid subunit RPN8/RPN11